MPFDGTNFPQPSGRPPGRKNTGDSIVTAAIIMIALGLLLTPMSIAALVDILQYAKRN
jgi:hypothetical protein